MKLTAIASSKVDESPRPRGGKARCFLHDIILKGITNGLNLRNGAQRRVHVLENQSERWSSLRVQFASSCFKLASILGL